MESWLTLLPQSFHICGHVYFLLFYLLSVLALHCCTGFSLVAAIRGYSLVAGHRLLTAAASLVAEHGPSGAPASAVAAWGLGSCRSWVAERRFRSCDCTGLVVPQHVGSSQARDRTHVSSIGRQILFFFLTFIFHWKIIILQYCDSFCHTSPWISHRQTHVPLPQKPPSQLHTPGLSFPLSLQGNSAVLFLRSI